MMSGRDDFPFTATQWQELEHQALIFKYMVSGIPIPPDLLFSIKRNCLDSRLFSRQPTQFGSWNCFHMGLGRKVDPEPGRCRRTDGKKWRCSKEAYPDSKYCARHMHRGKNRSRKPLEALSTTTTTTLMAANPSSTPNMSSLSSSISNSKANPFSFSSLSSSMSQQHQHHYQSQLNNPFTHHHHHHNTPSLLDSGSYSHTNSDYRDNYVYGVKEEVDEHAFFSESSGTMRTFSAGSSVDDDSWQLTPLTMSSSSSSKCQRSSDSALQREYSYLQLQSFADQKPKQNKYDDHHQEHCYVMGSHDHDHNMEPQNTVHRFFDEWPPKHRDSSCLDLDHDNKSSNSSSVSTTRLSISIPSASHDFPVFNSRADHNDG